MQTDQLSLGAIRAREGIVDNLFVLKDSTIDDLYPPIDTSCQDLYVETVTVTDTLTVTDYLFAENSNITLNNINLVATDSATTGTIAVSGKGTLGDKMTLNSLEIVQSCAITETLTLTDKSKITNTTTNCTNLNSGTLATTIQTTVNNSLAITMNGLVNLTINNYVFYFNLLYSFLVASVSLYVITLGASNQIVHTIYQTLNAANNIVTEYLTITSANSLVSIEQFLSTLNLANGLYIGDNVLMNKGLIITGPVNPAYIQVTSYMYNTGNNISLLCSSPDQTFSIISDLAANLTSVNPILITYGQTINQNPFSVMYANSLCCTIYSSTKIGMLINAQNISLNAYSNNLTIGQNDITCNNPVIINNSCTVNNFTLLGKYNGPPPTQKYTTLTVTDCTVTNLTATNATIDDARNVNKSTYRNTYVYLFLQPSQFREYNVGLKYQNYFIPIKFTLSCFAVTTVETTTDPNTITYTEYSADFTLYPIGYNNARISAVTEVNSPPLNISGSLYKYVNYQPDNEDYSRAANSYFYSSNFAPVLDPTTNNPAPFLISSNFKSTQQYNAVQVYNEIYYDEASSSFDVTIVFKSNSLSECFVSVWYTAIAELNCTFT